MVVRVVEYMIDNRVGGGELFCLITTLADHEFAPAVELAAAYAQRWEIELSFDEIDQAAVVGGHLRVRPVAAPSSRSRP